MSKKYLIEATQRFIIETDDIKAVLENMEFTDFPVGVIGDPEFLDGVNNYEEVGEDDDGF